MRIFTWLLVGALAGCAPEPPPPEAPVAAPAPRPSGTKKAAPKVLGGLSMPKPRPCLPPPTDAGMADEGVVASRGLGHDTVAAVMREFVPNTLRCAPEGASPSGTITVEVTVACGGTVSAVRVTDDGGLPAEMVACVRDTLTYAAFPPHDLPDGETFAYPMTFRF